MRELCCKDLRGSRLRRLMLTSMPRDQVAGYLRRLIEPHGTANAEDLWMPRGFSDPEEARLGDTPEFLSVLQREDVTSW